MVMAMVMEVMMKVTAMGHLLTLDLMLEAVPYSSANILDTREIWAGVTDGLYKVVQKLDVLAISKFLTVSPSC